MYILIASGADDVFAVFLSLGAFSSVIYYFWKFEKRGVVNLKYLCESIWDENKSKKAKYIVPFLTVFFLIVGIVWQIVASYSSYILRIPSMIVVFVMAVFAAFIFCHFKRVRAKNGDPTEERILKYEISFLMPMLLFVGGLYFYNLGNYGFQMDEFYHAGVVKTFFGEGKMFFIGDDYYGRSKLTSFIGVGAYAIFNKFFSNIEIEFALRFSIALLGILNVLFVYIIGKEITTRKIAWLAAFFYGTATYVMYLATYFRFYTPALTVILFLLYLNIRRGLSYASLVLSIILSVVAYRYVSEYFLFVATFWVFVLISKLIIDYSKITPRRKVEKMTVVGIIMVCFFFLIGKEISNYLNSESVYNLVSWKLNIPYIIGTFRWLAFNYTLPLIIGVSGTLMGTFYCVREVVLNRKITPLAIVELYVFFTLLFIFGWMMNVPFNFTVRPLIFLLPILFLVSFKYLNIIIERKILLNVIIILLIASNIFFSIRYKINNVGDIYHPTQALYEKINVVTDNKGMAEFINGYVDESGMSPDELVIGYVGIAANHLRYYLDDKLSSSLTGDFRYRKRGNSSLGELKEFIEKNGNKNLMIVINANAMVLGKNKLYTLLFGISYTLEADPMMLRAIESDNLFQKIFTSADGFSAIYFKPRLWR